MIYNEKHTFEKEVRCYQNKIPVRRDLFLKTIFTFFLLYVLQIAWSVVPQMESFDYNVLSKVSKDPLYNPIGLPTIDPSENHLHRGSKAILASDVPICSKLGKEILLKGGNAADAAVTVALCIGSINSQSSGIGGGGYIVSLSKERGETISIDAREKAPGSAFQDMYALNPILSKIGGLAVAIPGELKGLNKLYNRHGSGNLTWYELFEPVIKLNREGFICNRILAGALDLVEKRVFNAVPQIQQNWDFVYNKHTGKLIKEGDLIKRTALADTLEIIAKNGSSDPFYDPSGPIVKNLVSSANSLGGLLRAEDFSKYEVDVEHALELNFTLSDSSYRVYTSNGASSGLALLAGLNFFHKVQNDTNSDVLETHKLIESMKWMASARSYFGDFSLNERNQTYRASLIELYTSEDWANKLISSGNYTDSHTFPWQHYHPQYELNEPHGTSHFSIVDENDNSISMTTTVNLYFGSMVYDNKTGVILNNQMDDFSMHNVPNAFNLTPSIHNFIVPQKRPLSSMSPTIIECSDDGSNVFNPVLLIGAAGGSRITTAVFQAIVRTLFKNMSVLDAIAYPRIHHQLMPDYVMVENYSVFEQEHELYGTTNIRDFMSKNLGHHFAESGSLTAMNAIKRVREGSEYFWEGVSDYWRKLGEADGF